MRVFSVGECPVCPGFGAVLAVTASATSQLLFYCPACGTAWTNKPDPHRIDEVNAIEELAPGGVIPATLAELKSAGLADVAEETDEYDDEIRRLVGPTGGSVNFSRRK